MRAVQKCIVGRVVVQVGSKPFRCRCYRDAAVFILERIARWLGPYKALTDSIMLSVLCCSASKGHSIVLTAASITTSSLKHTLMIAHVSANSLTPHFLRKVFSMISRWRCCDTIHSSEVRCRCRQAQCNDADCREVKVPREGLCLTRVMPAYRAVLDPALDSTSGRCTE